MSTLLLLLLSQLARAQEPYAMNDVGGTLTLPKGWESSEWADWSLKAKSPDGVLMRLYLTPFQVEPSEDNARIWAAMYQERLEKEGGGAFQTPKVAVSSLPLASGAVQGARVDLAFTFERQKEGGTLHAAAFPVRGQTLHIETVSLARNETKAREALETMLAGFSLEKGPDPVNTTRVQSESGFAFTPPPGWREPLSKELELVRKVSGTAGESTLDPKRCAVVIRPPATGEADVLFACEMYKHLGIVDEYSFSSVEQELRQEFFGKATTPVAAGTQARFGERLGVLYAPPVAVHPMRLAIAPYDKGVVLLTGLSSQNDAAGLDAAIQASLDSFEFTGPEGGAPIVAMDKRIGYWLKHRPTSPFVLGPAVLLVLGIAAVVALARRRKPDLDPD